jgi:hypothetical protein
LHYQKSFYRRPPPPPREPPPLLRGALEEPDDEPRFCTTGGLIRTDEERPAPEPMLPLVLAPLLAARAAVAVPAVPLLFPLNRCQLPPFDCAVVPAAVVPRVETLLVDGAGFTRAPEFVELDDAADRAAMLLAERAMACRCCSKET